MSVGREFICPVPIAYNRVVRHSIDGDGNFQAYSLLAALSIRDGQRAMRNYSEQRVLELKLPVFFHILCVMFQ